MLRNIPIKNIGKTKKSCFEDIRLENPDAIGSGNLSENNQKLFNQFYLGVNSGYRAQHRKCKDTNTNSNTNSLLYDGKANIFSWYRLGYFLAYKLRKSKCQMVLSLIDDHFKNEERTFTQVVDALDDIVNKALYNTKAATKEMSGEKELTSHTRILSTLGHSAAQEKNELTDYFAELSSSVKEVVEAQGQIDYDCDDSFKEVVEAQGQIEYDYDTLSWRLYTGF